MCYMKIKGAFCSPLKLCKQANLSENKKIFKQKTFRNQILMPNIAVTFDFLLLNSNGIFHYSTRWWVGSNIHFMDKSIELPNHSTSRVHPKVLDVVEVRANQIPPYRKPRVSQNNVNVIPIICFNKL